ncbi:hypothetical protein TNCV_4501791 [Trichonephila clavipes]|nr:hypothetical protein TNCV_4501791 [Trichonephila clavipes]
MSHCEVIQHLETTDLIGSSHGQVKRTTPDLKLPLSKLVHYANGKTLILDRFNVISPPNEEGLQWHQITNP